MVENDILGTVKKMRQQQERSIINQWFRNTLYFHDSHCVRLVVVVAFDATCKFGTMNSCDD